MTKRGSADIPFFLIGGRDYLSTLTMVEDRAEAVLERTTVFGNAWETQGYAGLKTATLTQEGFYDDAALSVHEGLSTGLTLTPSPVLIYSLEGNTAGARFIGWEGVREVNYERQISLGALHKAKATYKTDGAVDEGVILRTLAATTVTGNTTAAAIDNGASNTNGAAFYLAITDSTQINVAVFRFKDSPDNLTFSDLSLTWNNAASPTTNVSATQAPAGPFTPFALRGWTTGAIQRYTAVEWSFVSASAGKSITFLAGIARGITSA